MIDFNARDIFVKHPPHQTLKAWEPFWDCVGILFQFQNSDIVYDDTELREWRIYWIAGITLLRTVGHVLSKVDSASSKRHAKLIDDLWQNFKSDREEAWIFWDFIEKERSNLIKTYTFGAKLSKDNYGYYVAFTEGEDAFRLFQIAVYWWRHQLMALEETLHQNSP